MPWPFDILFMQLALAAGLVVGATAPLIGTFLVQRRLSLMGDGIGHVAFAGVALGLLVDVWPIWTALIVAIAGALAIELLRGAGTSGDLALAVLFYGGIAAAVVLIGLADALNASILQYLFGAILLVTSGEVVTLAILGLAIIATVVVSYRGLFAIVIDEEAARVAGLPVRGLNMLLSVLTAITIVLAMRVVGILLVAALMVLPAGASQALGRSFRGTLFGASAIGIISVVLGLVASRAWDLRASGTIVIVAVIAFAIASILGRGAGVMARTIDAHAHEH